MHREWEGAATGQDVEKQKPVTSDQCIQAGHHTGAQRNPYKMGVC